METEELYSDEQISYQEEELYPKFELTDEYGNPIRDARFYPFVSRVISAANRTIASKYQYQHFDEESFNI